MFNLYSTHIYSTTFIVHSSKYCSIYILYIMLLVLCIVVSIVQFIFYTHIYIYSTTCIVHSGKYWSIYILHVYNATCIVRITWIPWWGWSHYCWCDPLRIQVSWEGGPPANHVWGHWKVSKETSWQITMSSTSTTLTISSKPSRTVRCERYPVRFGARQLLRNPQGVLGVYPIIMWCMV